MKNIYLRICAPNNDPDQTAQPDKSSLAGSSLDQGSKFSFDGPDLSVLAGGGGL